MAERVAEQGAGGEACGTVCTRAAAPLVGARVPHRTTAPVMRHGP